MKLSRISGIITAFAIMLVQMSSVSYAKGVINVKDYGAKGDGVTNDTAAIQAAVNSAQENNIGEVYFPKGTYITVAPIKLESNIRLFGAAVSSVIETSMTGDGQGIFEAECEEGIEIEGLKFSAQGDAVYAAVFKGCDAVQLKDNTTIDCALSKLTPYYGEETVFCNDILVKNNNITGADTAVIVLEDTHEGIVIGNIINGGVDGIRLVNNTNEAIFNTACSENVINDMTGTAIFAKNIERLTIGHNIIKNVNKGIEASNLRYAALMGNIVNGFTEKGIVLTEGGIGLNINANEIYSDIEGAVLFDVEKSQNGLEHKTVNVTANTFHGLNGVRVKVFFGDVNILSVNGNHFYNTTLDITQNPSRTVMVSGNQMIFEGAYDKEIIAIKAGMVNDQLMIQNNQIRSTDFNMGSIGICAVQNDKESSATTYIKGNSVNGMDIDIKTVANSENPIVKPLFLIKNNYFGNKNYVREEGNTQASIVRLEGNYMGAGANFPFEIPTRGKWEKGQIIYFNSDNQTGYVGAVCIAKGTPGIWKYFGKIEE